MGALVISVTPIYGYGWVSDLGLSRDTPSIFDLELIAGEMHRGTVVTSGHEFERASAMLKPRHVEADGLFNVEIRRGTTLVASGYAQVDLNAIQQQHK